ncbi:barstar family protein [Pectobacterium carotovorum]|uniref:barstar family protein n=2 Tax=Pectobacterium carotovorum TaxID=554 RepID=UPI00191E2BAE|nr:barstar family protein [Pectobacterium carotovorum]MBL0906790.1 barstar family protein [Pectobacterium carotovorum]
MTMKSFFVRLDPLISSADEFLKSMYYLLWFPGYFGFNWNSLYDCLRDFEWISYTKIVIEHDSLPNIPDFELKIYLEILRDAVIDWEKDESHQLEVVFYEKNRMRIYNILMRD